MAIAPWVSFFGFATGILALATIAIGAKYSRLLGGYAGKAIGFFILGILFEVAEYVLNALWNATALLKSLDVGNFAAIGIFLNLCSIVSWLLAFNSLRKIHEAVFPNRKTAKLAKMTKSA